MDSLRNRILNFTPGASLYQVCATKFQISWNLESLVAPTRNRPTNKQILLTGNQVLALRCFAADQCESGIPKNWSSKIRAVINFINPTYFLCLKKSVYFLPFQLFSKVYEFKTSKIPPSVSSLKSTPIVSRHLLFVREALLIHPLFFEVVHFTKMSKNPNKRHIKILLHKERWNRIFLHMPVRCRSYIEGHTIHWSPWQLEKNKPRLQQYHTSCKK